MPTVYKELIRDNISIMKERARRLKILYKSHILPKDEEIFVDQSVKAAVEILRSRPERVLDWFSEEELALCVSLEEEDL